MGLGPPNLPIYILLSIGTYKGIRISDDGPAYVAIPPTEHSLCRNLLAMRAMFPIRLHYASSVRKAQGLAHRNGVVVVLSKDSSGGTRICFSIIICSMYTRPVIWRFAFFNIPPLNDSPDVCKNTARNAWI